jgi:hypothetical protein
LMYLPLDSGADRHTWGGRGSRGGACRYRVQRKGWGRRGGMYAQAWEARRHNCRSKYRNRIRHKLDSLCTHT